MLAYPDPKNLFDQLHKDEPVLVAVSGGSDSVALLLLSAAWARLAGGSVLAATVDHGLRAEAAAEAAFVGSLCDALDISHVTLAWEGLKPTSSISQSSREARYRLLAEFAKDSGCSRIMTGHTRDDQIETLIMRNARGNEHSDSRGLAGMAKQTRLADGCVLYRPLLEVSRTQLRNYLKDHNQVWIEDPSNDDHSYERVRTRARLTKNHSIAQDYSQFGILTGRFRRCMNQNVAEALVTDVKVFEGPVYYLSENAMVTLGKTLSRYLIQIVVAMAGGGSFLVGANAIDELHSQEGRKRITAGNTIIESYRNGLRVYRENRNLPSRILNQGESCIWDGRIIVRNNSKVPILCCAPDIQHVKNWESQNRARFLVRPRAALLSTLMVTAGDQCFFPLAASGSLPPEIELQLYCSPIEHFCPEFDFPLLDAIHEFRSNSPCFGALQG